MDEEYARRSTASADRVLDDADRGRRSGIKVGAAVRRIARECNGTQKDHGVCFDKDGRHIAAQPYNAAPSCGADAYAPGHVFYVRGRGDHGRRGRMTQREAQAIVTAAGRYGAGNGEAGLYRPLMGGDR